METDEVLRLIARVSSAVIEPRFRALADDEIAQKGPGDLVTIADREAERAISAALAAAYPEALVVGEEATAEDPALRERLAVAEHAWVVDPVDGTRNFAHGSPDYAVMLAELIDRRPVRAWIYQPQHGRAFVAERGRGVTLNGAPLTRSAPQEDALRGATSRQRLLRHPDAPARLSRTRWCCGVDYPMLAGGELDFLVYGPPKPWDHCPGVLMVTELGGVCRMADGSDYDASAAQGLLICAADERVYERVHALL